MPKIKTREAFNRIVEKADKAVGASERARSFYLKTKKKTETVTNPTENTPEEYASDRVEDSFAKAKDVPVLFRKKSRDNVTGHKDFADTVKHPKQKTIKMVELPKKTIKTAEEIAKTAIKTANKTAKAAEQSAKASAKAIQRAAQKSRQAAETAHRVVAVLIKATIVTTKAVISGFKSLVFAIATGGVGAAMTIVLICSVALMTSSVFGIFFSGEDSGSGISMRSAVGEINADYDETLQKEKESIEHDILEINGGKAVWKEVLAVYSVKTNTSSDNPQEVATMDESKKQILKDIFWEMNTISSRAETSLVKVVTEESDEDGNITQTETTETKTTLYITVSHKTIDEMAEKYGFDQEQKNYLEELLKDENNSLWSAVLYGITTGNSEIVSVAISQIGNVGGTPYWSWYGFNSRVEWCACFVSWCANECGYIEDGVIPKYAGCISGVNWFKERTQWSDGGIEPKAGMIIFFDWDIDGLVDHTGIVEKCEEGFVYTIEGNSQDQCARRKYAVDDVAIYGYGMPNY